MGGGGLEDYVFRDRDSFTDGMEEARRVVESWEVGLTLMQVSSVSKEAHE